ncbi:MAG: hypothetical protein E3K32_13480 [wastewater metagenome]|nr:hypothetical protein [Candidatus Loosdrechtia aerotolerans]
MKKCIFLAFLFSFHLIVSKTISEGTPSIIPHHSGALYVQNPLPARPSYKEMRVKIPWAAAFLTWHTMCHVTLQAIL